MLTQDQKNRLSPEQLIIAEKWEKEKEDRDIIFNKFQASGKMDSIEETKKFLDAMLEITPTMCEHERSVMSRCSACDEIERLLYPEDQDEL